MQAWLLMWRKWRAPWFSIVAGFGLIVAAVGWTTTATWADSDLWRIPLSAVAGLALVVSGGYRSRRRHPRSMHAIRLEDSAYATSIAERTEPR